MDGGSLTRRYTEEDEPLKGRQGIYREGMQVMEKEIAEEFISGFCKLQNQTRTVICEFEVQEDGTRKFYSSDCAYGRCEHSRDCLLMGQIL